MRPDASGTRRKTLIMIGGGDTYCEELCLYVGPAALRRGYNVKVADLPGQGDLPFHGLPMQPDAETPMAAVVDAALSQPDVDGDRLAAFGISAGGYLVPRARPPTGPGPSGRPHPRRTAWAARAVQRGRGG